MFILAQQVMHHFQKQARLSVDTAKMVRILIRYYLVLRQNAQILTIVGTDSDIYRGNIDELRTGAGDITPISRDGGYSSPRRHGQFAQFGEFVLATNGTDKVTKI